MQRARTLRLATCRKAENAGGKREPEGGRRMTEGAKRNEVVAIAVPRAPMHASLHDPRLFSPPLFLVPLLPLTLFVVLGFADASTQPGSASSPTSATTYIVTFRSYRPPADHAATIRDALRFTPRPHFHLLPRPHRPTDFLLLETPSAAVVTELRRHRLVRRVSPDRLTRHPLALAVPHEIDAHASSSDYIPFTPPPTVSEATSASQRDRLVSVAVFDTGIAPNARVPLASAHDWTPENTTADYVGHGTFVASLIAGLDPACPGLAPRAARIHVFRVFTSAQISYTSWFLDAFNYALHLGVDVLNLSIGGPDFADRPFVDKVTELTAHGVVVTSAIGNDGPLWGSLNNPADLPDVIGVGGAEPRPSLASFSSRGMTTHALPTGYGRVKPDLLAPARSLVASGISTRCTRLSGTSVASPVVAAAVVLLAYQIQPARRPFILNPASAKRALLRSARVLPDVSIYEQGAGLLDIPAALEEMARIDAEFGPLNVPSLLNSTDQVSSIPDILATSGLSPTRLGPGAYFFPPFYDLRASACQHMWPHCAQPLFRGALSTVLNVTIFNPAGVEANVTRVEWLAAGSHSDLITVHASPPTRVWPWAAGMGVHITAVGVPDTLTEVEGILKVRIVSVHENTHSDIELPIKAEVIPPPPRAKRLLWDTFHSIRYPPGYVPRDSLAEKKDMLDWLGDHPHTNFHILFRRLLDAGFYVDILDRSLECLGTKTAQQYGAILFLDSEDYFSGAEIRLVDDLVKNRGTALIIAAEWYNLEIMRDIRFEDDNTRSRWTPVVAGGNVPALNDLLRGFGIAFGDAVMSGNVSASRQMFRFESGVPIVRFPSGGEVLFSNEMLLDSTTFFAAKEEDGSRPDEDQLRRIPVFGISKMGSGTVVAYGDTNCIDMVYKGARCYDFFVDAIGHAIRECTGGETYTKMLPEASILRHGLSPSFKKPLRRLAKPLPKDLLDVFRPHSRVLDQDSKPGSTRCSGGASIVSPRRRRIEGGVVFPIQRTTKPIPAQQSRYLGRSNKGLNSMPGFIARTGMTDGSVTHVLNVWRVSYKVRSYIAMAIGVCLIVTSFTLRRGVGAKLKKMRKHGKHRLDRTRSSRGTLDARGFRTRVPNVGSPPRVLSTA